MVLKDMTLTGGKKSTDLSFHPGYLEHKTWGPLLKQLIPVLEQGLDDYLLDMKCYAKNGCSKNRHQYLICNVIFQVKDLKVGIVNVLGIKFLDRLLVWMVYLNDVNDKGETEFFYQHHFEEPKQGKLVIWPSDWTHLHRGIISPTETKYILTGWYTHIKPEDNELTS